MDITKAKKVVELEKDGRKILVTLWEGDRISSCIEDQPSVAPRLEFPPAAARQYCETCEGDAELCQNYIEHLKERGYSATEVELGELEVEESLPRFLEQRGVQGEAEPEIAGE